MRSSKSSNNPGLSDDWLQIGQIIGAHGIGGAVKVCSYAESTDRFAPGSRLTLVDAAGHTIFYEVIWAQAHKKVMRLALQGVTTREQAEELVGWGVFMACKDLPPLEADTYYWRDLLGMPVYTVDGEYLGQIEQIIPTGANDVYVVKTPADHPAGEILIPAIASVILDVDLDLRSMRVALPEGLI